MTPNTRKNTPNSTPSTEEKRGVYSVKDTDVSLTNSEPRYEKCTICNDDGKCLNNPSNPNYEYDPWDDLTYIYCMGYIRYKEQELGLRKPPQVEVWDKVNKKWNKK
jgi:hypothetical protein